ncbi:MAG: DNA (cytosine-5-)-methyltransferase [Aquirufa antheringensis]|nr:DNA (cytosine-5-)-methyltransferase [Aquirufa antheringensis]
MRKLKFIDLFSGLGGFHVALNELGHKCVFASEINPDLRKLYFKNHGLECSGDINKIEISEIPDHNIICAGFPCQPFSKAGKQNGLNDPLNGSFFNKILEIADYHKSEYLFLENVPNLKSHDNGETLKYMRDRLAQNYHYLDEIISPHFLGVPQNRSRIYIVCRRKEFGDLNHFNFPGKIDVTNISIHNIIEEDPKEFTSLKPETINKLKIWQEFIDHLDEDIPSFPIWAMEFGATYPYEEFTPSVMNLSELASYKGKFGCRIDVSNKVNAIDSLPNYAQLNQVKFPNWKIRYIKQNRDFYKRNKHWLDGWLVKVKMWENSHLKFEWNCGKVTDKNIFDKIVQFRPSGIRVKLPNFSPTLVLTSTQIPVFPWLKRYMTVKEAAKLQCLERLKYYPDSNSNAFRAFGNAVNACVVFKIAKKLIK